MNYLSDYAEFSKSKEKLSLRQKSERWKNIRQTVSTLNRTSQEARGWTNFIRNMRKENVRNSPVSGSNAYKTSAEARNWLGFVRNLRNDAYRRRGKEVDKMAQDYL